tara:strand:+ start:6017 stop:6268 length:252 start_codon:yes stop_codon:yes gene_type:complete
MSNNIKELENALQSINNIIFTTQEERIMSEIVISGIDRLKGAHVSCHDKIKSYLNEYVDDYYVKCPSCLDKFKVSDGDISKTR